MSEHTETTMQENLSTGIVGGMDAKLDKLNERVAALEATLENILRQLDRGNVQWLYPEDTKHDDEAKHNE
jgi:hypothetical protein